MCGRVVRTGKPDEIAAVLDATEVRTEPLEPCWNVAPSLPLYAAVATPSGARRLGSLTWGLVPSWADDPSVGNRLTNARAETVATKPSFASAFARRRCLVPVDGFYEWLRPDDGPKQPFFISRRDGRPLVFAGLWEVWRDRADEHHVLRTCALLTTRANSLVAQIHDRMPVIVPRGAWDEWLDPRNGDVDDLARLLEPAPDDLLEMRPVSTAVNSSRNDGPELLAPVPG